MKKIIIMSAALTATLLAGEAMMAAVFGFVMVTGYLAGYFLRQPGRRAIECRVLAIRGDLRGSRISLRKGSSESMLNRIGVIK